MQDGTELGRFQLISATFCLFRVGRGLRAYSLLNARLASSSAAATKTWTRSHGPRSNAVAYLPWSYPVRRPRLQHRFYTAAVLLQVVFIY